MITEKLIEDITTSLGSDHTQVNIAIQHCQAQGVLTKYELRQLESQGLPISRILRTMLHMKPEHSVELILDKKQITYSDLMCMIGIIAQDIKLKHQKRY